MKIFTAFVALTFLGTPLFCQPKLLKDINPGSDASQVYADNAVRQVGNVVYFIASAPGSGAELWKTDGTTDNTQLVKDIRPGANSSRLNNFYALGDLLLFTADEGVTGLELWRSDGTDAGTSLVKNIGPGATDGIYDFINNPKYFGVFDGKIYFGADNGVNGLELWSSDGTEVGTTMVKDIYANSNSSFPVGFEVHNGALFFAARSASQGEELWKTDGTTTGTVLVKDIQTTGFGNSSPDNLRSIGTTLIFTADDGVHDIELWKTDGTAAGTVLVKDIKTTSAGSFSTSGFETQPNSFENRFARVGDIAFFSAIDDANGIELWKTDGTEAGTVMVKNASAAVGSDGYAPQNFAPLGDKVYYKYDNDISGIELWKSDGTSAGTNIVKDIEPGSFGSFFLPTNISAHLDKVYFGATSGNNGIELQVSDGTANGTKLLADLNTGSSDSWPNSFVSLGRKLIFRAAGSSAGDEPWVYIPPINVGATATAANCFGDSTGAISLQINPDAVAPFTAVWQPAWVSGLAPANLPAGTYSVTVTDADGATGTASATIGQPALLSLTATTTPEAGTAANGTATANATGGTSAYTYLWNTVPPQTTKTATNLVAGEYVCTVTDAKGCTAIATATVMQTTGASEKAGDRIRMTFQPNPAGAIAYWSVAGETAVSGKIMQASGQVLRNLTDGELAQGQLDVGRLSAGSYFLLVVLKTGQTAYAHFVVAR